MLLPADPLREGALDVVRTLRAAGHDALFAGGSVRDRVMGLTPKDYDVATSARPEAVMALFSRSIPVGVQFGVVRVLVGVHTYEVATFRAEADYRDGRRPGEVRWADAQADVLRRDFTINGLLEDPLAEGGPLVLDFVGGQLDLAARIVRAIGHPHERFREDHLRLLRCVRFAARMGFDVEPATWQAVMELAPLAARVSPERTGDELDKIITQGHQRRGLELLGQAGLVAHALPEVARPDLFAGVVLRMAHLGPCDPVIAWGTVLFEVPDEVSALAARLRWSRARLRDVAEAVMGARDIAHWPKLKLAQKKRVARRATFGAALVIAGAAGHPSEEAQARDRAAAWTPAELRPTPLLTGDDLKGAGYPPGPAFRHALDTLESAQLEGLDTRDDAWALVRSLLS